MTNSLLPSKRYMPPICLADGRAGRSQHLNIWFRSNVSIVGIVSSVEIVGNETKFDWFDWLHWL